MIIKSKLINGVDDTLKVLDIVGIKFRDFSPFLRNFVPTKSFETTKLRH